MRRLPWLAVAVWATQLWFLQWHGGHPNPNETSRLYLTRAIVEERSLAIDAQLRRFGDTLDKAVAGGRAYSDKAPGASFLAVPAVALASALGEPSLELTRHLAWGSVVGVASLALLLALERLARRGGLGAADRALLLAAFGLSGPGYTYATVFFGHLLAAALVLAVYLGVRGAPGARTLLAAGAAAGAAVATEYPTVILVAGLALLLVLGPARRRSGWFAAGAAVPLVLLALYHATCFGGPLETGYAHLGNASFERVHARGLLGVTLPSPESVWGLALSPARGLFFYSPWLVAALAGLVVMARRREMRAEAWVIGGCALAYFYFASAFGVWHGGGAVGPRHLTPLVPLLAVPLVAAMRVLAGRPRTRLVLVAAVLAGVVLTLGTSVPWPYPSIAYANPFSQLGVPMWRDGFVPRALLETAGVPARAAQLVLAALVATVLGAALGRMRRVHALAALAAASLWLLAAAWIDYSPPWSPALARDRAGIMLLTRPELGREPESVLVDALGGPR